MVRALALLLPLAACAPTAEVDLAPAGTELAAEACATCVEAKLHNRWCDECGVGYVASLRVESEKLFETLDAHGHTLNRDKMSCETCKALMDTGGFCESCRHGWVDGQAYMSNLTYRFALGEAHDLDALDCDGCRVAAAEDGWCDACEAGWAGNTRFASAEAHVAARVELKRLRTAIEVSERCETCAMYVIYDGTCPFCKIRYEGGKQAGG